MGWQIDKKRFDVFTPRVKEILQHSIPGCQHVDEAGKTIDQSFSTDFICKTTTGLVRVSSRGNTNMWSKPEALKQFSFRYSKSTGVRTEYSKVLVDPPEYGLWYRVDWDKPPKINSFIVINVQKHIKFLNDNPEFIHADCPPACGFFTYAGGDGNKQRWFDVEYFMSNGILVARSKNLKLEAKV